MPMLVPIHEFMKGA